MNDLPEYWENALLDAIDGEVGGFGEEFVMRTHEVVTDIVRKVLQFAIEDAYDEGYTYADSFWIQHKRKDLDKLFEKYDCRKEKA